MSRILSRAGCVLLLTLVTLVWTVGAPAQAHDAVERTLPGDGTSTATLPASVEVTMSEEPVPVGTQMVVTGPSGQVQEGTPSIDGRTVRQAIAASAPGGQYTVAYRVTSSDGHPVTGTFTFYAQVGRDGSTATAGPTVVDPQPADPQQQAARESQFVPVLLTIVATLMLAAVAGMLWWVVRRRAQAERAAQGLDLSRRDGR